MKEQIFFQTPVRKEIEQLYKIDKTRADWVFEQTQIEAENRRKKTNRIDLFIFIERIFGLSIVASLCIFSAYIAYKVAMSGHELAAIAIGSTAPIGLFSAFFKSKK